MVRSPCGVNTHALFSSIKRRDSIGTWIPFKTKFIPNQLGSAKMGGLGFKRLNSGSQKCRVTRRLSPNPGLLTTLGLSLFLRRDLNRLAMGCHGMPCCCIESFRFDSTSASRGRGRNRGSCLIASVVFLAVHGLLSFCASNIQKEQSGLQYSIRRISVCLPAPGCPQQVAEYEQAATQSPACRATRAHKTMRRPA